MVGKTTTEGDRIMRSDLVRQIYDVDGNGIKIGIISDSFNLLSGATTDIANGDLPGQGNPNGFSQGVQILKEDSTADGITPKDEGRAMAQIVHDVAPGSELLFHSWDDGDPNTDMSQDIATAVKRLADAGADLIVDDTFVTETFFQDDVAARAINEVTSKGIAYFSSAGNYGNHSYENPFRAKTEFVITSDSFSPEINLYPEELADFNGNYLAHDFDPSEGVDLFQEIKLPQGQDFKIMLNWSEAIGAVNSDLEMFIFDKPQLPDAGGKILATSYSQKNKPIEGIRFPLTQENQELVTSEDLTVYLAIAKKQTETSTTNPDPSMIKWIDIGDNLASYEYVNDSLNARGSSTIYGHNNARGAITVGAVDVDNPLQVEQFSSVDSTPILFDSQGNPLATPEIRQKPEIIAPDGVSTYTTNAPGFDPFYGTSAAAPHAAAVAALMLEQAGGKNSLTPEQIRHILANTDSPLMSANFTPSNSGLIQADIALAQTLDASKLASNDELIFATGKDSNFNGNDELLSNTGNYTLVGAANNDLLATSPDNNVFTFNSSPSFATHTLSESQDLLFGAHSGITDSGNFGTGSDPLIGSLELASLGAIEMGLPNSELFVAT